MRGEEKYVECRRRWMKWLMKVFSDGSVISKEGGGTRLLKGCIWNIVRGSPLVGRPQKTWIDQCL